MTDPNRNVEIKARVDSLEALRPTVAELAHRRLPDQSQRDTYFHCRRGRLKLREIEGTGIAGGSAAQLIWYERPDRPAARQCDYQLVPVADPHGLRQALEQAWGIRVVVRKDREIYLFHNVRIHLDRVEHLGSFLELEAVIGPDAAEDVSRDRVQALLDRLKIDVTQYESASYAEMQETAES